MDRNTDNWKNEIDITLIKMKDWKSKTRTNPINLLV